MAPEHSREKLNEIQADIDECDLVIIGSGLFGCTIAEQTARLLQKKVVIIEARDHLGGNSFSYKDSETNIEIHKYGTHIFHTDNKKVWSYVNEFAEFNNYLHKVVTNSQGKIYSLPVNLFTLSQVFEKDISPVEAEAILGDYRKVNGDNFEDLAISTVGKEIYELFFKGYTQKQWGIEPNLLPAETFSRLPVRNDMNLNYFKDRYQGIPKMGYGHLISTMLKNPKIKTHTNSDFFKLRQQISLSKKLMLFTGPLDRYFDYKHGALSWRTVDFELETHSVMSFQGIAVKNFSDLTVPYTRIHEYKFLHPEREDIMSNQTTVIAKEFSRMAEKRDEPYYPVNSKEDRKSLLKYRELQALEKNVVFGGRLATYQYLDMHMAIGSALSTFENEITHRLAEKSS